MAKDLIIDDLEDSINKKIYSQDYSTKPIIEGVQLVELKNYTGDEGDFTEVMKFVNGHLENIPDFSVTQINRTLLFEGSVKAWHLHLKQDEIWYVAPMFHLFVGLWDIRKNSKTCNQTMRVNLGGSDSHYLYIPRGVAHGSANFSNEDVNLFYLVNQTFNRENPDELRISWDALGAEFWSPQRD